MCTAACADSTGPESVKGFPGRDRPATRATQDADDGRRGTGYVFGAFRPTTGEAFTHSYARRTGEN
ncbi:hypothetical protein [Zavarzinella formosa]|uniref:hypothetical protein n=1 Tax=Zavarzinella formosa TaxID=360055 RepID=UPI0002DEE1B5|nr:hypothetical protein [Zavarzinella formosa]